VDWKLAPQANSGIFFHVVEQGQKEIYATGPEYQLIDDDGWQGRSRRGRRQARITRCIRRCESGKAGRRVEPDANRRERRSRRALAQRREDLRLQTLDAGVDRAQDERQVEGLPRVRRAKQGKLGLQNHGNMSWFRNIKVRRR
jgi:hypothetical protein